jgi:hypothetical protein
VLLSFTFAQRHACSSDQNLHVDQTVIWLKSTGFLHECIGLGKTKVRQLGC